MWQGSYEDEGLEKSWPLGDPEVILIITQTWFSEIKKKKKKRNPYYVPGHKEKCHKSLWEKNLRKYLEEVIKFDTRKFTLNKFDYFKKFN